MVVRRMVKNDAVVAGGGAIEMEISKTLRDYSRTIAGKEQLLIGAIARALEVIPRYIYIAGNGKIIKLKTIKFFHYTFFVWNDGIFHLTGDCFVRYLNILYININKT